MIDKLIFYFKFCKPHSRWATLLNLHSLICIMLLSARRHFSSYFGRRLLGNVTLSGLGRNDVGTACAALAAAVNCQSQRSHNVTVLFWRRLDEQSRPWTPLCEFYWANVSSQVSHTWDWVWRWGCSLRGNNSRGVGSPVLPWFGIPAWVIPSQMDLCD